GVTGDGKVLRTYQTRAILGANRYQRFESNVANVTDGETEIHHIGAAGAATRHQFARLNGIDFNVGPIPANGHLGGRGHFWGTCVARSGGGLRFVVTAAGYAEACGQEDNGNRLFDCCARASRPDITPRRPRRVGYEDAKWYLPCSARYTNTPSYKFAQRVGIRLGDTCA